ncbi:hypothetical protein NFJ02_17g27210 [Pycnococcus provasolii]
MSTSSQGDSESPEEVRAIACTSQRPISERRVTRMGTGEGLASFAGLANACLLSEPARFFLRSIYVALETRSSWKETVDCRQALRDLAGGTPSTTNTSGTA